MGRAPCCDKENVKRGPWSPDEDAILKNYIDSHGTGGNWIALPKKAGLRRCGKSCRLRWLNYLRPDIKHGGFTEEEDNIICKLYNEVGSRWSVIASQLPGRTDNDIKNYWNTKLKKKILSGKITNPTTNAMDTDQDHQPRGISDQLLPPLQYVSSSSVSDQSHALSTFQEPFDIFAHSYVVKPDIGSIGSDHFGNNNSGSIGSIGSDHFGSNNGSATIPAQECSSIASSNSPGMETGFGGSPGGQFDDWLDFSWEKIIEKLLSDDASIGPNFTDDLNFQ